MGEIIDTVLMVVDTITEGDTTIIGVDITEAVTEVSVIDGGGDVTIFCFLIRYKKSIFFVPFYVFLSMFVHQTVGTTNICSG